MSATVTDLLKRLLEKDASKRLGRAGAHEVKQHSFFRGVRWTQLAQKRVAPPIKPQVSGAFDTRNFAEEFTRQPAAYSPAPAANSAHPNAHLFRGYSYLAPSILFSENAVSRELLSQGTASSGSLLAALLGNSYADPFSGAPSQRSFFDEYSLNVRDGSTYLGAGSFSIVRKCRCRATGTEFAVKIVSRRFDVQRELDTLRACQSHPNVVRLVDAFADALHVYIVTELLRGGELLERIRSRRQFTEHEANRILKQLLAAVAHLHLRGVVHRDLKPENVLFDSDRDDAVVKIVDFGFARFKPALAAHTQRLLNRAFSADPQRAAAFAFLTSTSVSSAASSSSPINSAGNPPTTAASLLSTSSASNMLQTPCFTLQYAAPEVLRTTFANATAKNNALAASNSDTDSNSPNTNNSNADGNSATTDGYDESCDFWSLGVIMYTMLSGQVPFHVDSDALYTGDARKLVAQICDSARSLTLTGEQFDCVSAAAKELLRGLLSVDPRRRFGLADVVQSSWLGTSLCPHTPLMTPGVLQQSYNATRFHQHLAVAFDAYQRAQRERFTLLDVDSAPLAKRRKQKLSHEQHFNVKNTPVPPPPSSTPSTSNSVANSRASIASSSVSTTVSSSDSGVVNLVAGNASPSLTLSNSAPTLVCAPDNCEKSDTAPCIGKSAGEQLVRISLSSRESDASRGFTYTAGSSNNTPSTVPATVSQPSSDPPAAKTDTTASNGSAAQQSQLCVAGTQLDASGFFSFRDTRISELLQRSPMSVGEFTTLLPTSKSGEFAPSQMPSVHNDADEQSPKRKRPKRCNAGNGDSPSNNCHGQTNARKQDVGWSGRLRSSSRTQPLDSGDADSCNKTSKQEKATTLTSSGKASRKRKLR